MDKHNSLSQEKLININENCQCPLSYSISLIGGKWKCIIIHNLRNGAMRFGELRRANPKITQRMLTLTLRELQGAGIIHREVFEVIPPHVEYSLTKLGEELEPVMQSLSTWGKYYYENHKHLT